ncbi:hypothetical protein D9615_000552 [Tricholomella constricta]|uniref:DUF4050 domain-containing protein n=1 Tax=Tricholomella constricta TaxID=117010 RepID=A0A8H5MBN3_9AGAR|nr:hypothetical protein D9615_000552 [Tricholomella constricta]
MVMVVGQQEARKPECPMLVRRQSRAVLMSPAAEPLPSQPGPSHSTIVPSTFDDILAATDLPPPGPDYYAARRTLWLAPRPSVQHAPVVPSTSRQRLEHLLSLSPHPEDEYVWNNGLAKVWKTLDAGGRLKRRLPMALIIRVIHAAWVRDDTWPAGAVAPEPDDVLPGTPPAPLISEYSSGATTPWLASNHGDVETSENTVPC